MKKKAVALLLVLSLVLGLLPMTAMATGRMPFTDVKETDWFYDAVQYVYEKDMMNGTGESTFSPDITTTRGMIVTILYRLEGLPSVEGESFTDVSADQYYSDAVAWASASDIVNGYGDGTFGPNDPITREQLAAILYRYMQYKGYATEATGDISEFTDGSQVSSYAVEAMNWAVGVGLISGVGNNTLAPKDIATRAQVAMILMRFCTTIASASYTVTFEYNYDNKGVYKTVTVEGDKTVDKPTNPTRSGYSFDGWYTAEENGEKFHFDTVISADITLYAQWSKTGGGSGSSDGSSSDGGSSGGNSGNGSGSDDSNGSYIPSNPNNYRVTFDKNDGTAGVYQVQRVTAGQVASEPTKPARELYRFTGWYMEPTAITKYNFDTPISSDLTLYAGWGNPDGSENGLYAASNNTETIFSVSDIRVDGDEVVVTYNTNDVALISVEFFEDQMKNGEWTEEKLNYNLSLTPITVTSGYTDSYGELATITLPITDELPDYYLVRAKMSDSGTNSTVYVTAQYTSTYAAFNALTVNDFDEESVIDFGGDGSTNFGVIKDSVIVIPELCRYQDGQDLLRVDDIEDLSGSDEDIVPDHLFTFPDKNAVIDEENGSEYKLSDLVVGDIIYIEGTTWMFKIKTIQENEDGSISFTQDKDVTMLDFYDTLKVDFEGAEEVDGSESRLEVIDKDGKGSIIIGPFSLIKSFDNGIELSGSISGKVTGNVKLFYDAHLFSSDYFEASFKFSTEITGTAKATIEKNNDNEWKNEWKNVVFQVDTRKVKLPTPVTGLDIYVKPTAKISWSLSGEVSFDWTSKQTSGFKYNSDTGRTDIKEKENTVSIMAKGNAVAKIGPILDIGVQLLGGVLKGSVVAEAGAKLTAKAETGADDLLNNVPAKHACGLCVSGRADWYASAYVKCSYKINNNLKGDIVKVPILDFTAPITFNVVPGEYFVSIINSSDSPFGGLLKFGGGECTNKTYRTEFVAQDANGHNIDGIQVSVARQGQAEGKSGSTPYVAYLYNGTYAASAEIDGTKISKMVVVSGDQQNVILSKSSAETILEGTVVDANNRNSAISNVSVKISRGNIVIASAETDNNGKFSIAVPTGSLTVKFFKENYLPFSSTETIHKGDTVHSMGRIELTPGTGMGGFRGVIRDAVTNNPIPDVTLNLYEGWNNPTESNTVLQTLKTDSNGAFRYDTMTLFDSVIGLPSGHYTLMASKEGYADISYNIIVYPGTTDENPAIDETMSPEMGDGFYRIVLTWGMNPKDLDSHLVAKTSDDSTVHVYFSDKNPDPHYAELDVDDTDSEGPETITITNFNGLSDIRYAVHDYTNRSKDSSNALSNSGAVVRVYKGKQLLRTFNVPTGYGGTEWNVFTLKNDGTISSISAMTYCGSPQSVLGEFNTQKARFIDDLKDYEIEDDEVYETDL